MARPAPPFGFGFGLALACSFVLLVLVSSSAVDGQLRESNPTIRDRKGKLLSIFQIVTFPNDPCDVGGNNKNGTCYTAEECAARGGSNAGSCASGFGVCCTFTVGCGATSSENCTYFDLSNPSAGACQSVICPCGNDICQMRLDFDTFVITGPSTATSSVAKVVANSGVVSPAGAVPVSAQSQCLTDTFSVTMGGGGISPPTICGTNTGEHMYLDVCQDNCNTLSFAFGNTAVGTTTANRQISIKVTQYSCSYPNLAPQGCTQYFFGSSTGSLQTFNYNSGSGQHLANQDQSFCVRRERENCRICYYAVNPTDFVTSITTAGGLKAFNKGTVCCSYVASTTLGFDCVNIPGAVSVTNGGNVGSNICGGNVGLVTASSAAATTLNKSICSNKQPFILNFRSDNYEMTPNEAGTVDGGFTLGYTMDSINCP